MPKRHLLQPGTIYVAQEPATIATVLGNSVAVCLWDKRRRYGGMNHFLYPATNDPSQATGRFGNAATKGLLKMMQQAGCELTDLTAQLFGGASMQNQNSGAADPDSTPLGQQNVAVARSILARAKVRIVSEDVGGTLGRKIAFDIASGEVAVFKVQKLRDSDWLPDKTPSPIPDETPDF